MECDLGYLAGADGSALFCMGNTRCVAAVFGPREPLRRPVGAAAEKGAVRVEVGRRPPCRRPRCPTSLYPRAPLAPPSPLRPCAARGPEAPRRGAPTLTTPAQVVIQPFAMGERRKRGRGDKRVQTLSAALRRLLEAAVMVDQV